MATWWPSRAVARMRRDGYVKCSQLCAHCCSTLAAAQNPCEDKGSTDVFMREVVHHKTFTHQALNLCKSVDCAVLRSVVKINMVSVQLLH